MLRNDRNIVQGCCPLKVLVLMASGTLVIASDLPVRALAEMNERALLKTRIRQGDLLMRCCDGVADPDLGT